MDKYIEQFINNIKNKTEKQLQTEMYNYDLNNNKLIIDDFGTIEVPLKNLLDNLKLNKKLTIEYYKYLDKYDLDDSHTNYEKFFIIEKSFDIENTENIYNYDNNFECVIQYCIAYDKKNKKNYMALEVQNGGDVRINYSNTLIYEFIGDIDYLDMILNYATVFVNNLFFYVDNSEVTNDKGDYLFSTVDFIDSLGVLKENTNAKIEGYCFEY